MKNSPDATSGPAGPLSATAGTSTTMAVVIDAVAVLVFALLGKLFHDTAGFSVLGWIGTAWPFLLGAGVAWALLLTGVVRPAPGTGVGVLIVTWFVGIVVRAIVTMSVAWGFVLTSLIFLGILLIGWRAVASFVTRRQTAS
ncbi:DUF3054 domain-containing protein [Corynebacterium sp. USCH3]|uniref:DUF3054 domain-containing protein n=1 Tax=Corynebacterium sp. USCH3 TaxID=3024840 RepID=UPI0030A65B91